MRTTILTFAAGLALSVSTAALADYAETPTAQPISATATSEKLVCHHMVHQGMLLKRVECRTQKEWDNERRSGEHDFADFQNRSYSIPMR